MNIIEIDNHEFIIRYINNVVLASTALKHYVENNNIPISGTLQTVSYYIDPMKLINMTDEQLQNLVKTKCLID